MAVSGVYLDYNATTPTDPRVLEAMLPYFTQKFGNPASTLHAWGWEAEAAVAFARERVAEAMGAHPSEIVFTSGATEALNFILKGAFEVYQSRGKHIISLATEHKAVLDCLGDLHRKGAEITLLPVNSDGMPDLEALASAIRPDTIFVTMMWANNETGLILPVHAIADICHSRGTLFFTDATQAVGKVATDVASAPIAALVGSAHKFYGPKGIGFVFLRKKAPRFRPIPLLHGGGHESGYRSGTLNVPGIVGLAEALTIARAELQDFQYTAQMRQVQIEQLIADQQLGVVQSANQPRLPHVTSLTMLHHSGKELALKWPWMGFSMGSACTAASQHPSHVLRAMGMDSGIAERTIRISTGRFLTDQDWNRVLDAFRQL